MKEWQALKIAMLFSVAGCSALGPADPVPATVAPRGEETAIPTAFTPTLAAPTPVPTILFAETRLPRKDADPSKPSRERRATPTPEVAIPSVVPGDILTNFGFGRRQVDVPPTDDIAYVKDDIASYWGIIRASGDIVPVSDAHRRVYFDEGVIFEPDWLPDGERYVAVSHDQKQVRILMKGTTTVQVIRHMDIPGGTFDHGVKVDPTGRYVVVKKVVGTDQYLDIGETTPHHGGSFWKAPAGWRIGTFSFGIGQRAGDLLVSLDRNGRRDTQLGWLTPIIPDPFPVWVDRDCYNAPWPENNCEMKYIRDEHGKLRTPDHRLRWEPVVAKPVLVRYDWNGTVRVLVYERPYGALFVVGRPYP